MTGTKSCADYCPRCREFKLYPENCRCKLFHVAESWQDKVEDDAWREIYADDAQAAAESYAERDDRDSAEYIILQNGSAEIWTRDEAGNVQKWNVEAESVPQYTAREKR